MKRGMTLIEITVALALSTLLLVTTAGVIKSMQQKKKVFADRLDVQQWRIELAKIFRNDFLCSREMRIGTQTLELSGFCGHDPTTGEPTQTPVHVRWALKSEDGYDILIRTETLRGGIEELSMKPRTEPMAVGVTNISIGAFAGLEDETDNEVYTVTARSLGEPGDWATMPKVIKLVVHGPDNIVLVDELIYR